MYICMITGKVSKPGQKLRKVVALTRPKTYTKWIRDEEVRPAKWMEVPAGVGHEIVMELSCSEEGEALWNSWNSEDRAAFLKHMSI